MSTGKQPHAVIREPKSVATVQSPLALEKKAFTAKTVELSTPSRPEIRLYMACLAAYPGLFSFGLMSEVCSFSLYAFLEKKPWLDKDKFVWHQPEPWYEKVYSPVSGVKPTIFSKDAWIKYNVPLTEWGNRSPTDMAEELLRIGRTDVVPKRSNRDFGKFTVTYSMLVWAATELFPREKYIILPVKLPKI